VSVPWQPLWGRLPTRAILSTPKAARCGDVAHGSFSHDTTFAGAMGQLTFRVLNIP
jgi:hypothetical protein